MDLSSFEPTPSQTNLALEFQSPWFLMDLFYRLAYLVSLPQEKKSNCAFMPLIRGRALGSS